MLFYCCLSIFDDVHVYICAVKAEVFNAFYV